MKNDGLIDFSDKLYYSNLESKDGNLDSQLLIQNTNGTLRKYVGILTMFSKILEKKANSIKLEWKQVDMPDDYKEDKSLFAIQLRLPGKNEINYSDQGTKEILQQISNGAVRRLRLSNGENKNKEYIDIIEVYDEENGDSPTLIVDKLPGGNIVSPALNDLSLKREMDALKKLKDRPENYLFPILRLADQKGYESWSEPDLVNINQWKVLTDAAFPGVNDQRKMVRQALSTKDFAILEGPPGSGKTTVLSELILQLLLQNKRVLLVGSTHVAVDNVLEKIIKYTDVVVPIRMAHVDHELPPEIMDLSYHKYIKSFKNRILRELLKLPNKNDIQEEWIKEIQTDKDDAFLTKIVNDSINLVSGTTIGVLQFPAIKNCIRNGTFQPLFDVMIIDEASKTNFPEFLVPAIFAKKWIISGDPKQLSPYTDRESIEGDIESLLKEKYQNCKIPYQDIEEVSLISFRAYNMVEQGKKDSKKTALVVLNDDKWHLSKYISEQIEHLKNTIITHIIPKNVKNEDKEKIIITGSDIIIIHSRDIQKYADSLPYGIEICGNISLGHKFEFRNRFYFKALNLKSQSTVHRDKDSKLSKEIAWRLIRHYEMRMSSKQALLYKDQITDLIPHFDVNCNNNIWDKLNEIKYTILPSILEILLSGNSSINPNFRGSVLESGFPEKYKKSIWTLLSYQYRMHPEISRYPRELVYTSEGGNILALKDTAKIDRNWNFKRYAKRAVWLNVEPKKQDGTKYRKQNVNSLEADKIIMELNDFVEFASKHSSEKPEWSVAIMSFYAQQTRVLKGKVGKKFKRSGSTYYNDDKTVKIFVGNVDAMQGREADIVYLSMVRTGGLGFLDNMNRINVAITRARYQLVIVGNHRIFKNSRREDALVCRLANAIQPTYEFKKKGK